MTSKAFSEDHGKVIPFGRSTTSLEENDNYVGINASLEYTQILDSYNYSEIVAALDYDMEMWADLKKGESSKMNESTNSDSIFETLLLDVKEDMRENERRISSAISDSEKRNHENYVNILSAFKESDKRNEEIIKEMGRKIDDSQKTFKDTEKHIRTISIALIVGIPAFLIAFLWGAVQLIKSIIP